MDRGQVYTLEGVIAGMIVLLSLLFVIQATSVTPGAVVTNDQQAQADSALSTMNESTLRQAVLYWNTGESAFYCTPGDQSFYPGYADTSTCSPTPPHSGSVPPIRFGNVLDQSLGSSYSYNVYVAYNDTGEISRQRMIYQGQPGGGSIRVSRSIVLFDGDYLRASDGTRSGTTLETASGFYAPDITSADVYNVVHIEVVVWQ